MAEIKFLTEKVATKIEDDSLGGGGRRRGREISESRLVHILHDDIKICVVPQIQRTICKCNTSITEFYLDQLHHESHLIFNKKKKNLSSNLNNQFYSPHFLDQSHGRLIKVSAERNGANWKEGTLSRHLYYS